MVAAAGHPSGRGDRDRHAAPALRAVAWRVEVAPTAGAVGKRFATARAVCGRGHEVDATLGGAQMTALRAPIGMRRSSSICRSSSAERPSVVK